MDRKFIFKTLQSWANLMESRIGMVSLGMFNPVIQLINDIKLPPILQDAGRENNVVKEEKEEQEEGNNVTVKEEELWRDVEAKIENTEGQDWLN